MLSNFLVFVIGFLMGVFDHAKRNNNKLKKPKNNKTTIDLGFLTDAFMGAIGAIFAVILLEPVTLGKTVMTAILGGYAGESLIVRYEAKLLSTKEEQFKKNQQIMDSSLENGVKNEQEE